MIELLVIKGFYMKDDLGEYKSKDDRKPNPLYWGEIKSKEQLAWRILAWIIPFSWIVLIIKFIIKLPPKE